MRVAVVGAGFGGLAVARALHRAGERDLLLLDRAPQVGGTWQANTYPGVACDAPSHLYRFSDAPAAWSRRFAPGAEIAAYLERCAEPVREHLRLGCGVRSARWTGRDWELTLEDATTVVADVLVAATGKLSAPCLPDLPGLADAEVRVVHTARWPADLDLAGRRVVVVGTGASAVQVVPAIADDAAHVTVLQRSAPYVLAKPDRVYAARWRGLHARVPVVPVLARLLVRAVFEAFGTFFWRWPRLMGLLERRHAQQLERDVADAALRAALTPTDRAGCKRPLISSDWHRTLARPDVSLVTSPAVRVEGDTVVTADGRRHRADVVVLATGFRTEEPLADLPVEGPQGSLAQRWSEGPHAHLGISVPGFPNLFCVYGPGTNLGAGSIVDVLEAQAAHVVDAVRLLRERPGHALEVTERALAAHEAWRDRRLRRSVWTTGCTSWYLDARGRDVHNCPATVAAYRRRARRVDPAAYRFVALGGS